MQPLRDMAKSVARSVLMPFGLELRRIEKRLGVSDVLPILLGDTEGEHVLFDVGANHGQTTARLREVFPKSRIFAFEPQPVLANQLSTFFSDDPLITVVAAAVSDSVGRATLHLNSYDQAASLIPTSRGGGYDSGIFSPSGEARVPSVTLDSYCVEHGIQRIDYLKIDAQGCTREVLDGATSLLGAGAVRIVRAEITLGDFYERSDSFHDIEARLIPFGYRLHTIIDTDDETIGQGQGWAIEKATGALRYVDALYVLYGADSPPDTSPEAISTPDM